MTTAHAPRGNRPTAASLASFASTFVFALAVVPLLHCSGGSDGPGAAPDADAGAGEGGTTKPAETPVVAAPGELAIKARQARQTRSATSVGALEVTASLGNGVGGTPVPLNVALFAVKTSDGLLHMGEPGSRNWVSGDDCEATVLVGGGAQATCAMRFDLKKDDKPVALVYSAPGSLTGIGDMRTTTVDLTVEPCATCETTCTYFDKSLQHCGGCGKGASSSTVSNVEVACEGGVLVCDPEGKLTGSGTSPGEPITFCPAVKTGTNSGRSEVCTRLSVDESNCGACGNVLTGDVVCEGGRASCREGSTMCPDGKTCARLQDDENNCGACGVKVTPDPNGRNKYCENGKPTCASPYTLCGDACVDTRTDRDHCGACGRKVRTDQRCVASAPACSTTNATDCGARGCVNTSSDENNCGACGRVCPSSAPNCYSGECLPF